MQTELKEQIYGIMNGDIDRENTDIPDTLAVSDEFTEGSECNRLYQQVYEAKLRLSERLGKDEDNDVEAIIGALGSITHIMALKMYDVGAQAGKL